MRSGKEEGGWISVGELEEAFEAGSYAPPHCRELAGRRLRLCLDGGGAVEYEFGDAELRWRNASAEVSGWVEEKYYAAKVREGVYFVDHLRHLERAASMSIVVDFNLGGFIAVVGRLPTGGEAKEPYAHRALKELELTRVKATVLRGSINGRGLPPPRYEATGELVGKRAEYAYSPTQRYEHIYLNKRFYTWHCLSGAERSATGEWGLADTDACTQYKLGGGLYLHVWREKVIPTLGVVVIDLENMRTVGKIMGYKDEEFNEVSNFPVGAKIVKISSYVDH